jgi:ubiquinone biosynthesis protein
VSRQALLAVYRSLLFTWRLILHGGIPILRALIRVPSSPQDVAVRVRQFLESMGVTYLKLGQFLATRFDLLPPEVIRELGRLFEQVSPLPFARVRKQIEQELGGPLSQFFQSVEESYLGSASVAQVHKAVALDGEVLALKVQRPNVGSIFAADVQLMRAIAWVVDLLGLVRNLSLSGFVEEFAAYTVREMDFVQEARTAERVRREGSPVVYVPRIRWNLTTRRLLALEFIEGVSFAKAATLLERGQKEELQKLLPGIELKQVTHILAWATLHQLFITGFFHADPHPGNILIARNGRVTLIDFGIFGELSPEQVDILSRYVENLALGNIDEAYRLYARLLTFSPLTDIDAFRRDARRLLREYYDSDDRQIGRFADRLMRLLYEYNVRLDVNTLLFWRTVIVLDATSLRSSSHFDFAEEVRNFFSITRAHPIERFVDSLNDLTRPAEYLQLVRRLPFQARRALTAGGARNPEHQSHRALRGRQPATRVGLAGRTGRHCLADAPNAAGTLSP